MAWNGFPSPSVAPHLPVCRHPQLVVAVTGFKVYVTCYACQWSTSYVRGMREANIERHASAMLDRAIRATREHSQLHPQAIRVTVPMPNVRRTG